MSDEDAGLAQVIGRIADVSTILTAIILLIAAVLKAHHIGNLVTQDTDVFAALVLLVVGGLIAIPKGWMVRRDSFRSDRGRAGNVIMIFGVFLLLLALGGLLLR